MRGEFDLLLEDTEHGAITQTGEVSVTRSFKGVWMAIYCGPLRLQLEDRVLESVLSCFLVADLFPSSSAVEE